MASSRLCRHCREFHNLAEPWPQDCASHFGTVSQGAGFYIQSDTMDPFRSMADGKMYDSKSVYRSTLKARGLVEVGNERIEQKPVQAPPIRDTLRETYQRLRG